MTGDEAYQLHVSMRQFGIAGSVVPLDPGNMAGAWCAVDEDGQDVTGHVLARVAAARARRPERGFVVSR
ncbi:hypothetical protein ACFWHQ_11385 [Streptomyces sp. NPDC060334]|uniref:hypothetical protein n=1 Tax=Streptomyces sp. NPDC060334 TaxID=3347099 RepID=UPI00364C421C